MLEEGGGGGGGWTYVIPDNHLPAVTNPNPE